ncbi:MAG TPA: hypothetical protein VN800_06170 [Candidatus Acidoferrales bacterium]|nr:hypothetical protein [Candidatus Acidoferrales bacterium]
MTNDGSITNVTPPHGTSGQMVSVQVNTPGGSSPIVSADQYKYP